MEKIQILGGALAPFFVIVTVWLTGRLTVWLSGGYLRKKEKYQKKKRI
ncbi:MAG: hypothetical protein J6A09_03315 [Alphaproteobacteria bacterium]|nr:hypothetical protein [Alphaproteobacteria bacterium]